ncbi:MAG TPA: DUF5317 family protein [Acidimicrobiales bacterium]|jgi:hypothetical protein
MYFTAVAVAIGFALGLLTGGKLECLGERRFRLTGLLAAGLVVQVLSGRFDGSAAVGVVIASYALLIAFCVVNVRLVGMALVLLGLVLNFTTIAVNGGMPVRRSAVVAAGIADWDELDSLEVHEKRHLERPDDDLMAISDIIPVPVLGEVLSFGDIVMSVGVADVIVNLLKPLPARRRPED